MTETNALSADRKHTMLATAFGPAIMAALKDAAVTEIIVNADGKLWLEKQVGGRAYAGETLFAAARERILRLVASHMDMDADKNSPIISAELPETGARFEGLLPPIVTAPGFVIRKPANHIWYLVDYVTAGVMEPWQQQVLVAAIHAHMNILVVGGTGSGKTTLANALLAEIAKLDERLILIEDTRELQCAAADHIVLKTRSGVASLSDLVRSSLRLRPDRIIIGEVRGGEALDMLKAWNTGHPGGLATLHANSAKAALLRLEQLIQEKVIHVPRPLIGEAIHLIAFIEGRGSARKLQTLAHVTGFDGDDYQLIELTSNNSTFR